MEIGYNVWLYGTDSNLICGTNSEIALTSLPAVAEPDWIKCYILALHFEEQDVQDADDRHGVAVDFISKKRVYEMIFYPFIFPTEMSKLRAVYSVFRKRHKYICLDGAGQPAGDKYPDSIHAAGNALEIVCTGRELEHNDDGSKKQLTLNLRNKMPVIGA